MFIKITFQKLFVLKNKKLFYLLIQKEKRKEKLERFEGQNREREDIFQGVEDRRGRDYDSTGPHDKRYYVGKSLIYCTIF